MAVVLDVEWQAVCRKQFMLKMPRFGMFRPTHEGVARQPVVEPLLTKVRERHPPPTSNPTQREIANRS